MAFVKYFKPLTRIDSTAKVYTRQEFPVPCLLGQYQDGYVYNAYNNFVGANNPPNCIVFDTGSEGDEVHYKLLTGGQVVRGVFQTMGTSLSSWSIPKGALVVCSNLQIGGVTPTVRTGLIAALEGSSFGEYWVVGLCLESDVLTTFGNVGEVRYLSCVPYKVKYSDALSVYVTGTVLANQLLTISGTSIKRVSSLTDVPFAVAQTAASNGACSIKLLSTCSAMFFKSQAFTNCYYMCSDGSGNVFKPTTSGTYWCVALSENAASGGLAYAVSCAPFQITI